MATNSEGRDGQKTLSVEEYLSSEDKDTKLLFWLICFSASKVFSRSERVKDLKNLNDERLSNYDFGYSDREIHRKNLYQFITEYSIYDRVEFSMYVSSMEADVADWTRLKTQGLGYETIKVVFCASASINDRTIKEHVVEFLKKYKEHNKHWTQNVKEIDEVAQKLLDKKNVSASASTRIKSTLQYKQNYSEPNFEVKEYDNSHVNFTLNEGVGLFEFKTHTHRLSVGDNRANQSLNNPATILKWDSYFIDLVDRESELETLFNWLNSPKKPPISCHFICGDGGMGKTRLASEFANKLPKGEWESGFINISDEAYQRTWKCGSKGLLLIIDYPEEQASNIAIFFAKLANTNTFGKQLRILLLTRNKGFIERVSVEVQHLFTGSIYLKRSNGDVGWNLLNTSWQKLLKLAHSEGNNRSAELSKQIDRATFDLWQSNKANQTPLMIQALALYLFESKEKSLFNATAVSSQKIIRYLTKKEALLIEKEVTAYNKNLRSIGSNNISEISVGAAILTKALAAIVRGFNDQNLLYFIQDISDEDGISLRPVTVQQCKAISLWKDNQLPAIEPDILAADFLAYALDNYAEMHEEDWVIAALGFKRVEGISKEDRDEIVNIKIIGLLIVWLFLKFGWWPVETISMMEAERRFRSLGRLIYDFNVSLGKHKGFNQNSWDWPLEKVAKKIFNYRNAAYLIAGLDGNSLHLEKIRAPVLKALVLSSFFAAEKGPYLNQLGISLSSLGKLEESLKYKQKAVKLYKNLSRFNPKKYSDWLSVVLHNESITLEKLGYYNESLISAKKAVKIREALAGNELNVHTPHLVTGLNGLSNQLARAGRLKEALYTNQKALKLEKLILKDNKERSKHGLGMVLNNISLRYAMLGKKSEALSSISESVEIYINLSNQAPELYEAALALGFYNFSVHLSGNGNKSKALECAEKSVEIRRRLTNDNPLKHASDLILSLHRLSFRCAEFGYSERVHKTVLEAVENYEYLNEEAHIPKSINSFEDIEQAYKHYAKTSEFDNSLNCNRGTIDILNEFLSFEVVQEDLNLVEHLNQLVQKVISA